MHIRIRAVTNTWMRRGFRRWGQNRLVAGEEGALMIEAALALLVIMPLVFWLFEICMLTYTCSVLGDAARQGVRYAIDHGTDSTLCSGPSEGCSDTAATNVISVVKRNAAYSFHNLSNMAVQVTYPDGNSSPPSRVNVAIQYTYVPYIQLPGIARNIDVSAQGRIVF